ncbi:hypothetical protein [Burkholderia vietnamiensis]|uniref:hypothetical protein n=1 Tax=Burkholderia vietnamiensis TaxID=60552 RepID=UPI001CF2B21C|nr:hypothetical protein [Burkholderia vietnamiensis]MCA8285398.1 hypothetical protein [Burkholderia vietnamiensis]
MTKSQLLSELNKICDTSKDEKEVQKRVENLIESFVLDDFIHIFELADEGKIKIHFIGDENDTKK